MDMEAEVNAIWSQRMREATQQNEQSHRDPTVMAHQRLQQREQVREGMPGAVEGN